MTKIKSVLSDQKIHNYLAYNKSPQGKIILLTGWITPPLLFILAANNFYQSYSIAHQFELNFSAVIYSWLNGINIYSTYPGSYVSSVQQLVSGLLNIAMGTILLLGFHLYRKQGRINDIILQALRSQKEI